MKPIPLNHYEARMKQLNEVVKSWLRKPVLVMLTMFILVIVLLIVIRLGAVGPVIR